MLTALDKNSGDLVFADDVYDLNLCKGLDLVDPILNTPVGIRRKHFRKGSAVRCHFFSRVFGGMPFPSDKYLFDSEYFEMNNGLCRRSESYEHIEGKHYLLDWAKKDLWDGRHDNAKYVLEHRVFIERKSRYRIIDAAVLFPCGAVMALECQLSPITLENLIERTEDYESEGIDCLWFFGEKAGTEALLEYVYQKRGEFTPMLFFSKEEAS